MASATTPFFGVKLYISAVLTERVRNSASIGSANDPISKKVQARSKLIKVVKFLTHFFKNF